jgi:hypothetical protein
MSSSYSSSSSSSGENDQKHFSQPPKIIPRKWFVSSSPLQKGCARICLLCRKFDFGPNRISKLCFSIVQSSIQWEENTRELAQWLSIHFSKSSEKFVMQKIQSVSPFINLLTPIFHGMKDFINYEHRKYLYPFTTLLHEAMKTGKHDLVNYLLQRYPFQINVLNSSRENLLFFCSDIAQFQKLVLLGANPLQKNDQGESLFFSKFRGNYLHSLKEQELFLSQAPVSLTQERDVEKNTILHLAMKNNFVPFNIITWALNHGSPKDRCRINERNNFWQTPLHVACIQGNLEKINFLVLQGADQNAKDRTGRLPFHHVMGLRTRSQSKLIPQPPFSSSGKRLNMKIH